MKSHTIIYIIVSLLFLAYGCVEDPNMPEGVKYAEKPEVETHEPDPSSIMATSFEASGRVIRANGADVTKQGFLLGKTNPVTLENKLQESVAEPGENGNFKYTFTGLDNSEQYYVAAYATNVVGTNVGETFLVATPSGLGEIRTLDPINIKAESAIVGGKIIDKGEGDIVNKGIYYSKQSFTTPNQERDTVYVTLEADSFTYVLTGLDRETRYFVRAFVTTTLGTKVGEQKDFTTKHGLARITSFQLVNLGFTNVDLTASVEDEGDASVTRRGFCYGTTSLPTIANGVVSSGSGLGQYSGTINGLLPYTEYYVRAFAENSFGVAYSSEEIKVITKNDFPTIKLLEANLLGNASIQVKGEVLDEGLSPVSASGICWAIDAVPNIEDHNVIPLSSGKTTFTGTIDNLRGGHTYNVRVYATNETGTSYGELKAFSAPAIFAPAATFSGASRTPGSAAYFTIMNNAYLFGGDLGTESSDELWMYNPANGFAEKRTAPEALSWSSAIGYDQTVFILGGYDANNQLTNKLYQYVQSTNTWTALEGASPVPSPVARAAACRTNIMISFIGGIRNGAGNQQVISKEIWNFNPYQGFWERKNDFPEMQYGGVVAYHNNRMYAGLGIKSFSYPFAYSRNLYGYNQENDSWSLITIFPEESALVGTLLNNNLYVISSTGYIWCYDFAANDWTRKSRLESDQQTIHCIYTLNNKIYIGLGTSADKLISYDPLWDN